MEGEDIGLPRLCVEVRESHQRVYHAILRGVVPAKQHENGYWTVSPADVPKLAEYLRHQPRRARRAG